MRAAFVTVYPPSRCGIGDYAAKLVAALRRLNEDTEIDVYTLARDGVAEEGQRAILSMNPGSWWRLRKELSTGRYDVIHVQFDLSIYLFLIGPLFFILAAIRLAGRPRLVATYHEAYADRKLYGWFSVVFYYVFSRLFHRIYVHSRLAEECLITQYHVPRGKVRRIDHGTFEFSNRGLNHEELRSRWRLGTLPVVLCFGYIYKSKGIEVLIDAVRMLASSGRPLPRVIIAGEPPARRGIFRFFQVRNRRYLEELKLLVHDYGLEETVTFIGYVEDADLHSLFTLAEVVVLPYLVVDQSGVLNIAIAAQTPVIASDLGGLSETLAGVGIVVPPGSSTELARELGVLLASPDIRTSLRTAYREMAERLSTDNVAAATVEDYRAICAARPRRIVQVSAYYPPHLGGQEFVVEQLSQALARAGTDVTVVSSRLPTRISRADAIAVKRLWAREVAHTPVMPGLPIALLLRARGALFHLHLGQAFVPEIVGLVCGLLRRPYLSHVHLMVRPSGRLGRLLPIYQRGVLGVVLRRSAAVVCLTEDMRRRVIRTFSVVPDKAIVIANGVDESWFVSHQRAAKPGDILFVGRLTAQKNLDVVIRAMAELPEARLTVIGDGEDQSALERLVSKLGLYNVNFVGRREPAEVREAMLNASLLVLPSTYEGMPLVLLQAGAAGLPVVASDIPELREVGLAGRLVRPDEPAAWVAALRELLADDSILDAMSEDGVNRARSRRWECQVTEWTELYGRIFAAHRRN
jgi:glycosyltransferase involved in cell wall biosynthesis